MFNLKSVIYDDRIKSWEIAEEAVPHHIFLFVASGQALYWLDGAPVELNKGDALFIRQGTMRYSRNAPGEPHQKYSAHFTTAAPSESTSTLLNNRYVKCRVRNTDYFKQRFSMLLMQWLDPVQREPLICQGILLELLGLMLKEAKQQRRSAPKLHLVNELQNYIVHNYTKPLRLTDLAEHVNRSPNHLTKVFKEILQQTPIHYINQIKVSVACDLLQNGNMTIAEISDYLGFCEQSYFHRVFKKITGIAPSAVQRGGASPRLQLAE